MVICREKSRGVHDEKKLFDDGPEGNRGRPDRISGSVSYLLADPDVYPPNVGNVRQDLADSWQHHAGAFYQAVYGRGI